MKEVYYFVVLGEANAGLARDLAIYGAEARDGQSAALTAVCLEVCVL